MVGGRGAENDEVGLRLREALTVVGEHPLGRHGEVRDDRLHPAGLLIADPDDLGVGVFVDLPQQVPHVHVVEINPGDFPKFFHDEARAAKE